MFHPQLTLVTYMTRDAMGSRCKLSGELKVGQCRSVSRDVESERDEVAGQ
jgi:hypothetical protein